jgi:predicted nucleotidyltransferase
MSLNIQNLPLSVIPFLEHLASIPLVETVLLFGSRAVGDHGARADVDLAISAPDMDKTQFSRLRDEAYAAPTLYWVTLVHLQRTPPSLRRRIFQQGVVLYERPQIE